MKYMSISITSLIMHEVGVLRPNVASVEFGSSNINGLFGDSSGTDLLGRAQPVIPPNLYSVNEHNSLGSPGKDR